MISILVVDDHNTIHQIVKTHLETETDLEIVGFAINGQEAVEKVQALKPDIVLMDIEMPLMDGLTATKIISDSWVTTQVIILTVHDNEQYFKKALQLGAKGYLLKTTPSKELISAIRYAHKGYFQLGLDLIEKYLHKLIKLQGDLEEISQLEKKNRAELKEKVKNQAKVLEKLETKLQKSKIDIEDKLYKDLENIIKKNKGFLISSDPNTEFKLDVIIGRLNKAEKKISFIYKYHFIYILILTAITIFIGYVIGSS